MKKNLFVRIVAIFLCALMVLSVGAVAFSVLASAEGVPPASIPSTGSPDGQNIIVFFVLIVAVIVIAACLIVPKIKKK